jgi:hypothetical protein
MFLVVSAQQQNIVQVWDAAGLISSLRAGFQPPYKSWLLKIMVPQLSLSTLSSLTLPDTPEMGGNVTVDGEGPWGR